MNLFFFDMYEYKTERIDLSSLFPTKRDAFAIVLDNVFTKEECDDLIKRTETIGYIPALVGFPQIRVPENRNNYRCVVDDEILAAEIFKRIKNYVPAEWLMCPVAELNPRLRFLRYEPLQKFETHNDGIYVNEEKTKCSYITVHLYLNEGMSGGATTFTTEPKAYGVMKVPGSKDWLKSLQKALEIPTEKPRTLSIEPKIGRILIFEHHLLHKGSLVTGGIKYTVRSDIMYHNTNPNRGPRWSQKKEFPHPQYKDISCRYSL